MDGCLGEFVIFLHAPHPHHLDPTSAAFYLSTCRPGGRRASWDILFLFWSRTQHDDLANRWLDHLTLFYFKQNVLARWMLSDSNLLQGSFGMNSSGLVLPAKHIPQVLPFLVPREAAASANTPSS